MVATMDHMGKINPVCVSKAYEIIRDPWITAAQYSFYVRNQHMPPTAVAYNHDPYTAAFEAAKLKITHIY